MRVMIGLPACSLVAVAAVLSACSATPGAETKSESERVVFEDSAAPTPPPPPSPSPAGAVSSSTMRMVMPAPRLDFAPPASAERYSGEDVSGVVAVADQPVSTFSVDVDTGAYANVRRFLNQGATPPRDAVRTEEMINYFRYDYPAPQDRETPFTVSVDVAATPWNAETRLMRIGLRGYDLDYAERPPANLVFLVDVSGSMRTPDKLPLVQSALGMLADNLRPQDRVSIVTYSGATEVVLEPTNDPRAIRAALERLSAAGGTAGGAGLELAYSVARQHFQPEAVNRILLATDGDFNLGVTDQDALEDMIERNRDDGVTLTALGFGQGNYNEALMEAIADLGNGNYAYIDSAMEAQKVLGQEMSSTLFTIAKDVKIQIEFNPAFVSQYRLIGYENRMLAEEDFANDAVDAGDIGASHQVTAFYEIVPAGAQGWLADRRYEGNRAADAELGADDTEMAFVKLRYKLPDGDDSLLIERPVDSALLNAGAAQGDFAFAAAVAAFGQNLRGDPLLAGFDGAAIRDLAGPQQDFWRQEFLQLTTLAQSGGALR